jgi:hypothetical protein
MMLNKKSRPALAQCNKIHLYLAIHSKYHLLLTILLQPGLGQGFELIDQKDKKNYHVYPVHPVKKTERLRNGY